MDDKAEIGQIITSLTENGWSVMVRIISDTNGRADAQIWKTGVDSASNPIEFRFEDAKSVLSALKGVMETARKARAKGFGGID